MTTAAATTDLTTFRAHVAEHLERLSASGGVEFITVDGQTKGVAMAPDLYERMADRIEQAEITKSIRRGLADVAAGRVRPAEQVYRDLIDEFGLDPAIVYGSSTDGE